VKVCTKNFRNQFIEGQTHFDMPRGCSSFEFKHYLQACTTSGKKLWILYVGQPIGKHRGPTPDKIPIEYMG
jgi:hypothetical protein